MLFSATDSLRNEAFFADTLYCPILHRFFLSLPSMNAARIAELGFLPSTIFSPLFSNSPQASKQHLQQPPRTIPFDQTKVMALESHIHRILPSLMPSADFASKRERIRLALQDTVRASGIVPDTTEVALYGSSMNNFGNDDAGTCVVVIVASCISYTEWLRNFHSQLTVIRGQFRHKQGVGSAP